MAKKKTRKKAATKQKKLSQEEIADLDLDPVEDKETISALMEGDQELDGLLDEPVADKNKEPEVEKAEKVEKKSDIKGLEKVAKTENELMDMIALAKLNGVKEIEISDKLMAHYNRQDQELPNYFWFNGVLLAREGKLEAVKKELNRQLY